MDALQRFRTEPLPSQPFQPLRVSPMAATSVDVLGSFGFSMFGSPAAIAWVIVNRSVSQKADSPLSVAVEVCL